MTNKKKEYNLIPIVPVINITHIVKAYRNKVYTGLMTEKAIMPRE